MPCPICKGSIGFTSRKYEKMTDHPEIKVLLIEDDPEDAELLKEILFEEKGFSF